MRALKAHLAINVRNVEAEHRVLQEDARHRAEQGAQGVREVRRQNPPLNFTLNRCAFGERGALSHLGIQVASTEDVLAVRGRWKEAGLVTRDEMQTNCCYALQDKAWVRDPDGNEWEVFVVLEDNLAETSACCTTDAEGQDVCATTGEVVAATAGASSCCAPASPVTLAR